MNEDIANTTPNIQNFKIKNGRKRIAIDSISVDQDTDTVKLTLKEAVKEKNKIRFNYKAKRKDQITGVIEDLAGNDLQSIKAYRVTNNTPINANPALTRTTHITALKQTENLTALHNNDDIDPTLSSINFSSIKIQTYHLSQALLLLRPYNLTFN